MSIMILSLSMNIHNKKLFYLERKFACRSMYMTGHSLGSGECFILARCLVTEILSIYSVVIYPSLRH